ncbi:aldehyde dehydrogenase family protein [Blastococcus sp. TML/M2B]|nr:aldehyde dehydrogenase family protein [Blastococcus sp. TML/M2B]MBN1092547.1 aldehyde dehydrogenase family protein [Blastococcus sp. TML/M2B]
MASDTPTPYDGFDRMPIAGTWRAGRAGKTATDTDPYTGETLTEIPLADAEDLDEAYATAKEAQRDWAARLPGERAEVMRRAARIMEARKDEIVDWHIRESGAAAPAAEFEYAITLRDFHEAASYPYRVEGRILPADIEGKESRVYRRPVGVVAVISPWNVPMHLSNRSVAPALALGNAVVLKPAGDTPVTGGLLLAKLYEEAGLPPGLLSVVIGSGRDIGDAIVSHPTPRVVSFTGSTPVGKGIAEKAGLKKLSLELGGNGPLVVLDDADLGYAVDAAIFGKFFHQGQVCMITNRIVVDGSVHDEFVERYVERARALKAGDPRESDTVIGPIINRGQLEGIQEKIADALSVRRAAAARRRPDRPDRLGAAPARAARRQLRGQRPAGDVRPGGHDHPGAGRGRRPGDRQRHRVRPLERGLHRGRRPRRGLRAARRGRDDPRQRLAAQRREQHRVRGREGVRAGPLRRRVGDRGVHHRPLGERPAHQAGVPLLTPVREICTLGVQRAVKAPTVHISWRVIRVGQGDPLGPGPRGRPRRSSPPVATPTPRRRSTRAAPASPSPPAGRGRRRRRGWGAGGARSAGPRAAGGRSRRAARPWPATLAVSGSGGAAP